MCQEHGNWQFESDIRFSSKVCMYEGECESLAYKETRDVAIDTAMGLCPMDSHDSAIDLARGPCSLELLSSQTAYI